MKMKNTIQFRLTIVSISFIALIIAISWLLYHRSSFVWFEAKAEDNLESLYRQVNDFFRTKLSMMMNWQSVSRD